MTKGNRLVPVAVIGSSGGGTATLGHTDPPALLRCIQSQLSLVGGGIRHALYVSLDGGKSMDSVNPECGIATLYQIGGHDDNAAAEPRATCSIVKMGILNGVNAYCQQQQKAIAKRIRKGQVLGLICISCDTHIFRETLEAASQAKIPVTGSGGTSLSQAASLYQLVLVGNAGGSVATTSYTRAVSYTHALATHYKRDYQPWKHSSTIASTRLQKNRPTWTSVLNACLPAFWGVCLAKSAMEHGQQYLVEANFLTGLLPEVVLLHENWALPVVCAVVMATTSCAHHSDDESSTCNTSILMAAILASTACSRTVLGGLVAGHLVASWSDRILYWCIFQHVPATMTNLLTGGGVGVLTAFVMFPIARALAWSTQQIRWAILASVTMSNARLQVASGCLWGILSCYGSKVGYYHALHLPLILVEMETGSAGFLGAIDELSLVLVCAGICMGNLAVSKLLRNAVQLSFADIALCQRGLRINLCHGDFIECCYPFMQSSLLVNLGGYLGSALSSAWLVLDATSSDDVPKSMAYLPWPVSVALAGRSWNRYVVASLLAMGLPLLATVLFHVPQCVTLDKRK